MDRNPNEFRQPLVIFRNPKRERQIIHLRILSSTSLANGGKDGISKKMKDRNAHER